MRKDPKKSSSPILFIDRYERSKEDERYAFMLTQFPFSVLFFLLLSYIDIINQSESNNLSPTRTSNPFLSV